MRIILFMSYLLTFLVGCQFVHKKTELIPLLNYDYDFFYLDNVEKRRIELVFKSKAERQICVGRETWPSLSGGMRGAENSNGIYLLIGEKIFAYDEQDYWSYCVEKKCFNPLREGEQIEAFIPYEKFSLSDKYFLAKKILKYKPEPFWCDTRSFI